VNPSILRVVARPIGGLVLAAALASVPAAADAAHVPTAPSTGAGQAENYYCDWESGYGCAGYGYTGYPTDHGWDYGYWGRHHHRRHHRY
jgi:hypothetical protein